MIDLDHLERLAKGATPGPWTHKSEYGTDTVEAENGTRLIGDEQYYPWAPEPKDMAFMAAFNPVVALELIALVRDKR